MYVHAVRPGTDLARYARQLAQVHDDVLGGQRPARPPRPLVAKSWQRVVRAGLDPSVRNLRDPLPLAAVEARRAGSQLRLIIDDLVRAVRSVADASQFLLVVTDAEGVVLWRAGSARVRGVADRLGFSEGAEWTEDRVGTNAIGTALAEQAPVELFSAEHFEQGQHAWYCTAFPIHDPRTGELLGIVDVSGPALTLHPAIGALVETAVRLAEATLRCQHELRLERIRTAGEHVIASVRGPALLVDDHGWVAHAQGVARRDRVEVPRADTALVVPGLGLCLPERLREGWLVRPAAGERTVRVALDPTTAVLTVSSGQGPWRATLSARHVQILTLVHRAGRAGLTAAELSRVLFGDDEHQVTVRAEVSRLRRSIGAVLATRPYRVAAGVELTVHPDPPSSGGEPCNVGATVAS